MKKEINKPIRIVFVQVWAGRHAKRHFADW